MAFQVIFVSLLTALMIFSSEWRLVVGNNTRKSQPTEHGEVYRAKSQIDSLIYKLTLDLDTFNEKKTLAGIMQKDAEKLARIVDEEIRLLKPVQYLLNQLAKGNASNASQRCLGGIGGKIPIRIETKSSSLPVHYTISVAANHRELIDRGLTRDDGDDLQVYYHANRQHPVQIDRVLSGLGTKSAAVHFRLQDRMSANTVDDSSYSLVLGGAVSGSVMDNPDYVYAFHDDFSSSALKKEWATNNYGKWSVKNGRLLGDTMQTKSRDNVEIGLFVKSGFQWKDVEVELDLMETGNEKSAPGPILRVSNVDHKKTTGWWFTYYPKYNEKCSMRPQHNNKDGNWIYKGKLPTAFKLNTWFHFKYQVLGDRFSQWANGKHVHDNVQVSNEWKIPAGTLGLGCHTPPHSCKTLHDNIKVRFLVASPPTITLGNFELGKSSLNSLHLGEKKLPADSCKQIHDASIANNKPRAKNGVYWIKTDLQGSSSEQTYCDMTNGGWTLVGKISGNVGNIYKKWLVSNYNTAALKTPKITKQKEFACIDARSLAVEQASSILLSSGERMDGLGSKWVTWRLPGNREKESFWNHAVGESTVKAAVQTPVMVYAWNGNRKICYQNKFGLKPYSAHGGSYPYASLNARGNTATNDYCMAVGVMSKGSTAHGWSENSGGYDSPSSDSDWPNKSYNHQSPHLTVWLK